LLFFDDATNSLPRQDERARSQLEEKINELRPNTQTAAARPPSTTVFSYALV
jgi:hypothetical protein